MSKTSTEKGVSVIPAGGYGILGIGDIFSRIEELTGLEVSMYSPVKLRTGRFPALQRLPFKFQRHMSSFCKLIKANRSGKGCACHDSGFMVARSAEMKKPFVNICHAGVAEVIFPVYGLKNSHIATVFIGQAVTETVGEAGFDRILSNSRKLGGVDEKKLKAVFEKMPRMSERKLLEIGMIADLALKGLIFTVGVEDYEYEMLFKHYPAVKKSLRIMREKGFSSDINEVEVAEKLFLAPAYFSRLFRKVMKCTFSEYITEKRINYATRLLHTTNLAISDISAECGYKRQSYFSRKFKSVTGMSPLEYRRSREAE